MTRTFLDSGVLIAASRGSGPSYRKAIEILDDGGRSFVSSLFVRLEVLPKAVFYKRMAEVAFYETFFEEVKDWVDPDRALLDQAGRVANRFGLAALDALHVTSALAAGVDEFVTSERLTSPIHRVSGLAVRTIYA